MILDDIDIAEKALFSFTCKTIPRSKEEESNLSVLRNHPFFRISGKKDLDEKSDEYYYGVSHSALGEYFSPAVFKRLQSAFEVSLSNLKNRDREFISGKLVSLARVKEISNLRLETISEIMGVQWMEHFLSERSKFMGKSYPRQLTVIMTYECNLNCSFCYSMKQAAQEPGYLNNEMFETILRWMDGKNLKRVSLFGGEPTIHPDFINYIRKLNSLGYQVYFATNVLYNKDVAEGLRNTDVLSMTLSIPGDNECSEKRRAIIRKNISKIPLNVKKIFRITFSKENRGTGFLKELIEEFDAEALSMALSFPSPGYDNSFIAESEFSNFTRDIIELIEFAKKMGTYCALAKPVPLCTFERDDLMSILYGFDSFSPCTIHQNDFLNLTTITHTGLFYPCIALPECKSIDIRNNPDLDEISIYNRSIIESLNKNPVLNKCAGCNLFKPGLCQGFCYAYYRQRSG
jgi:MoaA/NifB/PqqE/SkfB family radical SAM enzyme